MFDIPWAEIWQDIIDVLLYVPRRLFELLLQGLAAVLNAIPVPAWFSDAGSIWSNIPGAVSYFFFLFNLALGVGILIAAWTIRWLIRRLPVVG